MFFGRVWRFRRFQTVMFSNFGFIFCCIFVFYVFIFWKLFLYKITKALAEVVFTMLCHTSTFKN